MTAQMLVIDGPAKGTLIPMSTPLVTYPDPRTGVLQAYHRHDWTMFGRVVHVLSVHASASEMDMSDMAEVVLSAGAQAASGWLPAPS